MFGRATITLGIGPDSSFYFFPALGGAKYCDERVSVSVCLSVCVCLSARISQKTHCKQNCLYVLPVAVARSSSDDGAIRYVLPVLWMTSCLPMYFAIQLLSCKCVNKVESN